MSLRDKRADPRDLPPRRDSLAERRSRRLERRSLAETFLLFSERELPRRLSFAGRFLAASAICRGRTRRTSKINAEVRMWGYRLLQVIRGLLPFYGFVLLGCISLAEKSTPCNTWGKACETPILKCKNLFGNPESQRSHKKTLVFLWT